MKSLIVLALLIASCMAFTDLIDDHQFILHRVKRQSARQGKMEDLVAMVCVGECIEQFTPEFEKIHSTNKTYFLSDGMFQDQKMNQMCSAYQSLSTCGDGCGTRSQLANQMLSMFGIFKIICVTHKDDFIRLMPCMKKAAPVIESTCDGRCGDSDGWNAAHKDKMEGIKTSRSMPEATTKINGLLDEMCDFMSCHSRCQKEVLPQQCTSNNEGRDAANLVEMILEEVVSEMGGVLRMLNPQITTPANCLSRTASTALKVRRSLNTLRKVLEDALLL